MTPPTPTRRLLGAIAIGLAASHALAADDAPPAKPADGSAAPAQAPAPEKPAAPKPKPLVVKPPPEEPPPAIPKVRLTTRRGQILPEGVFLVSRRGQLVTSSSAEQWGGWTFRFDPDVHGAAEAPMVLMPCSRLEAMQALASTRSAGVEYTVSGQVFVYKGRNYLLPVYDEARAVLVEPPTEAEPPAPPAGPASVPGSPEDEVQRRLRALDDATNDRRRLPMIAPAPDAPTHDNVAALRTPPKRGGLVAEGTYLASRRGRLVREADGEWAFRFDSDARGQVDPPMLVLPCMNLQVMESIASVRGDSITFTVSGQVYVYEDQNYLLPMLYRVEGLNPDLFPVGSRTGSTGGMLKPLWA